MDVIVRFLNIIFHLNFLNRGLEKHYQEWFYNASNKQNILAIKSTIIIYLLYTPLNYYISHTDLYLFLLVSLFSIMALSLLLYFIQNWKIRNYTLTLYYIVMVVVGIGPSIVILNIQAHSEFFFTDVIFPIFAIFTLYSIGFSLALMSVITLNAIFYYFLLTSGFNSEIIQMLLYASGVATFMAAIAGYFIEKSRRNLYLEKRDNDEFHTILQESEMGISILDIHTLRYLYANDFILTMHDLSLEKVLKLHVNDLYKSLTPELIYKMKAIMAIDNKVTQTFTIKDSKDQIFYIQVLLQYGIYKGEKVYIATSTDVTDLKIAEKKLERMATYDALTHLYNRHKFNELSEQEIARFERYRYETSLIICDIDFFKKVNDNYGHLVGDEILQIVAKSIVENTRESDICARWGGEEFAVLLPNTSKSEATNVAQKIHKAIESLNTSPVDTLTISCGISTLVSDDNLHTWFKRADDALYNAKESGRNRISIG